MRSLHTAKAWAPLALMIVAMFAIGWAVAHKLVGPDLGTGALLATAPAVTARSLKQILGELTQIQNEHKGKAMPEDVATKFETLAKEAKAIQDEADRAKELDRLNKFAAEVPDPALPAGGGDGKPAAKVNVIGVAGYISAGQLFTSSELYRKYLEAGAPQGPSMPVMIEGLQGRYVPLTVEQRKAVEAGLREIKAVPTLGAGVIEPQRLTELVRVTEHDQLTLRDVIDVQPTSSNAVEYMRMTAYTRAAAPTAESAVKPEAAIAFDMVSTAVRTIPVWIPITEQQLTDAPQLAGMINNELLYDLGKVVEEEMLYGSGAGQHFSGLFNDAGVLAGRTVGADTLLDKIRRSMTDVKRAGYAPNAVVMDPIDWEGIVLLKGTDNRYVWVVVTDENGDRIWALRVVESVSAEENAGNATEERNVLVGDFLRGATLWDRQQATVAVGWIDQQFIKNQRTIRAELRAAFGIKRPLAFRKINTQVAVP